MSELYDIAEDLCCSKDVLYDFLASYNNYIQEFYENHDSGSTPVCIAEFYDNEFQCSF